MGHPLTNTEAMFTVEVAIVASVTRTGASKEDQLREKTMTKSELTPEKGFSGHDEFSSQPFPVFGLAQGSSDETVILASENARLQRLVAELLIENQQLRQRYGISRKDAERTGPMATESDKSLTS